MRKPDRSDSDFKGHLVEYLVTSYSCPLGWRGKVLRKTMTEEEYRQVKKAQRNGDLKIRSHVRLGNHGAGSNQ